MSRKGRDLIQRASDTAGWLGAHNFRHGESAKPGRQTAVLDEMRGSAPRAVYLRRQLHRPPSSPDIATRSEALGLLTRLARDGRTQAVIALARELREASDSATLDWILGDG